MSLVTSGSPLRLQGGDIGRWHRLLGDMGLQGGDMGPQVGDMGPPVGPMGPGEVTWSLKEVN